MNDAAMREVTAAIEDAVAPHVAIVDWNHKADVQRGRCDARSGAACPPRSHGKTRREGLAAALIDL